LLARELRKRTAAVRFFRWLRSPDGRTFAALFLWVVTGANLSWCALDVRLRYEKVVEVQALRMRCEASGGFFGAVDGSTAYCLEPSGGIKADVRVFERETR
jgi:hypothetical protein